MVELRDTVASDVPTFFEHMQNIEQRWLAAFVSQDSTDLLAHSQRWERLLANPEVLNMSITRDQVTVGHIASYSMDGIRQITYWIGAEFSGQGVATLALKRFLEIETTRPLEARTAFDNLPSARVLEKNGFSKTGEDLYFAEARGEDIVEFIWVLE